MTYYPVDNPRPEDDPARRLGIIGLIFSVSGIFCGLIGLAGAIISGIAYVRSRRYGFRNVFALVGIIVGLIFLALGVVLFLYFPTIVTR